MGLIERLRQLTGLRHADPEVRLATLRGLADLEQEVFASVAREDADPKVRRAAVRRLSDPRLLAVIAREDADAHVRETAEEALLSRATTGDDETACLAALDAVADAKSIVVVARSAVHSAVGRAALRRLTEPKGIASVARGSTNAAVRASALEILQTPEDLGSVAQRSPHEDAALAAVERLSDPVQLRQVAEHAKCPAAAKRARALLYALEVSPRAAAAPKPTDRKRQAQLVAWAESLGKSGECDELQAAITTARDAWTDLIPQVDDDLSERMEAALRAARERLAVNLAERERRLAREHARADFTARFLAPRLALCERVESLNGEDAPRLLDEACWEWNRLDPGAALPPAEAEEVAALGRRFDEARVACDCRHAKWEEDLAEERRRTEDAAAREARETEERDNLHRLTLVCERALRLLRSDKPTLGKADEVLHALRAGLDAPPPLPSRKDRRAIAERMKDLHAALAPKVKDLRDSDRWQRWAGAAVQEELCAEAEALKEIGDVDEVERRLRDLRERWKQAGPAPQGQAQGLWRRFKAAADDVRTRRAAHRAEQEAAFAVHFQAKEALCGRAEALSSSTDWAKTAETLKGLQAEWKTLGPAGPGREKQIWERFRAACDKFFTARKEDLSRRQDVWAANLAAKEALCARAEELAASTDWETAAAAIKKLQIDWKAIGPVRRNKSESIWKRFRSAGDRFFERHKRRHEIDAEMRLLEREKVCIEVEALAASAAGGGSADAPPAGLLDAMRAARARFQKAGQAPRDKLAPLEDRLQAAFGRLVESHPAVFNNTEFDADGNRRRMEELVARLEKLGGNGPAAAEEALSPAARLATMWREAMATNTIGGRVAQETKARAVAEDLRRAREAWQRIGYVPNDSRRVLSERFERACRRLEQRSRA